MKYPSEDPTVVVVGAGVAGLFTAYYLQRRGYRNVIVLEKLGRVGGLCLTISMDGHSVDLGANYVTPAYREVRRVANELGLDLSATRPMTAMKVPHDDKGAVRYTTIFRACRTLPDGQLVPLATFLWGLARFCWLRWRVSKIVDKPTFEGVASYAGGTLTVTFEQWLEQNDLGSIGAVFYLPITLMGFGYFDEIPALYALKFMTLRSFVPMVLKETPIIGRIIGWPKQFTFGYQRLFERMAWNLDVRLNTEIHSVVRDDSGVSVEYEQTQQDLRRTTEGRCKLRADYLVLACPLKSTFVNERCDLRHDERRQFDQIVNNSYCMTTRAIELPGQGGLARRAPLAAVYPPPPLGSDIPYGVAKQWSDSAFAQFYTRTLRTSQGSTGGEQDPTVQQAVERGVSKLLAQMGARETSQNVLMSTFNRFEYFQHVSGQEIRQGWYDQLEKMQGQFRTFYVGGATNFELIEPIAAYAKHQVEAHFPPRAAPRNRGRLVWFGVLLVLVASVLAWLCLAAPPRLLPYAYPVGTGEGQAVSTEFWQEFQAGDPSVVKPDKCERSARSASEAGPRSSHIICRLMAAAAAEPADAQLPNLVASTLLWRVQSGISPETLVADLELAAAYADRSTANGNRFSPGFAASARWLLGRYQHDEALMNQAYAQLRWNTESMPAFHGFIEGEQLSTGTNPATQAPAYENGTRAFYAMADACVFGEETWRLPKKLRLNRPILNFASLLMRLNGHSYCYNTPPAPFGFPATYTIRGDLYLKAGRSALARIMYDNAQRSPGFEQFSYRDEVLERLRRPEDFRRAFLADSGRILGQDPKRRMLGQSPEYCASCHMSAH